jgi:hypothetical protein
VHEDEAACELLDEQPCGNDGEMGFLIRQGSTPCPCELSMGPKMRITGALALRYPAWSFLRTIYRTFFYTHVVNEVPVSESCMHDDIMASQLNAGCPFKAIPLLSTYVPKTAEELKQVKWM